MMAGGGNIQAMINSLRNNKSHLRRKSRFKKERSFLNLKQDDYKSVVGKLNTKKLTKEERFKIRTQIVKDKRRQTYFNIGFFVVFLVVFMYSLNFIIEGEKSRIKKNEAIIFSKKSEAYKYLISDGDLWLEKKHWNNAIFQYKKALLVFPTEYDAHYRISLAYYNKCIYLNNSCLFGSQMVAKLLRQYPSKPELLKLQKLFKNKEQQIVPKKQHVP